MFFSSVNTFSCRSIMKTLLNPKPIVPSPLFRCFREFISPHLHPFLEHEVCWVRSVLGIRDIWFHLKMTWAWEMRGKLCKLSPYKPIRLSQPSFMSGSVPLSSILGPLFLFLMKDPFSSSNPLLFLSLHFSPIHHQWLSRSCCSQYVTCFLSRTNLYLLLYQLRLFHCSSPFCFTHPLSLFPPNECWLGFPSLHEVTFVAGLIYKFFSLLILVYASSYP